MKLEASDLRVALTHVKPSVATMSPRPMLQCVLFKGREIIACDMRSWAGAVINDHVDEPILLPYDKLARVVRHLDGEVKISKAGTLTCGSVRARLNAPDNPEDFPAVPGTPDGKTIDLRVAIGRAAFAASKSPGRYAIDSVCLFVRSGVVEVVGCDGRRIAMSVVENVELPDGQWLVPISVAEQIASFNSCALTLSDSWILAALPERWLCSTLMEGTYPDYKSMGILGGKADIKGTVNAEALARAFGIANTLSNEETHACLVELADGKMKVSSSSAEGDMSEIVDVDVPGEAKFHVDSFMAAEALSVVSEDITFEFTRDKYIRFACDSWSYIQALVQAA